MNKRVRAAQDTIKMIYHRRCGGIVLYGVRTLWILWRTQIGGYVFYGYAKYSKHITIWVKMIDHFELAVIIAVILRATCSVFFS